MTKRFKHMFNRLGMQFICYDDKEVLLGTFADADGIKHIVDLLNKLNDENKRLLKANTKLTEENTNILSTIRTAYQNERTQIGRMVLKQLLDNLE